MVLKLDILTVYIESNFKWTIDLSVRTKTTKLLGNKTKQNIEDYLRDLRVSQRFLRIQKGQL